MLIWLTSWVVVGSRPDCPRLDGEAMTAPWSLHIPSDLMARLQDHLFPGDGDEHGAVIAAGIAEPSRGSRLLARNVVLARDGIDYVPGKRGYRMLTASFVTENILRCASEGLVYLAVHCHGGTEGWVLRRRQRIPRARPYGLFDVVEDHVAM